LARAAYSDHEIMLLDEPLSSVDANVGAHIFQQLIVPNGILKGKTRIMITHSHKNLHNADKIVVMKG
jgi:ABC-type bacteriocin/lantibiotic exporter with double-glycine peptidase domain